MKKIRIGNTIDILWGIFIGDGINEQPYDLTGRDLTMYLKDGFGKKIRIGDFQIDGHIIKWRYEGKDQCKTGQYSFVLVENEAQDNMYTVDECNAFQLVANANQAGCCCDDNDNIRVTTLEFRSKMAVGNFSNNGGGSSVTVDSALSTTSTNPVQNKVVTKAINELSNTVNGFSTDIGNAVNTANAAQSSVSSMQSQMNELDSKVDNLINNLLFPTVNPTFTAPSASISLVGYAAVQEVGAEAPKTENFSTSFNAGQITLSGVKQNNRAGALDESNSFVYYGASNRELPTVVAEGNTSYKYRAAYAEGPQPMDSKGNSYSTPLAAGYVDSSAVTVSGTWPWFASTSSASAETPVVKQALVSWSATAGAMSTGQFTVQPSGTLPQVFKLPRQLKTLQMLNAVSGQMDTIGTNDYAESTETINGRTYYVYTYIGSTRGSVTLLAKF